MWFKVMGFQKKYIESVSDEDAGAALKAALRMLAGEPIGELAPDAKRVFKGFEPRIMIALDIERCRKERENAGAV